MKKVLIYLNKNELAPKGGPMGYVYNLKDGLDKLGRDKDIQIEFLDFEPKVSKTGTAVKAMKPGAVKTLLTAAKNYYKKSKILRGTNHFSSVDLNQYDMVHFHSVRLMYEVRDSLKSYNGTVALTSHSPTLLSKEIFDSLTDFEKKHFSGFYKKLSIMDEYCFNNADYLIFPCKEAEEPYYNNWSIYKDFHEKNENKFLYFPTGTLPKNAGMPKSEIRKKYNVPDDAFVISYVGRHNEIKGYGDLKRLAENILSKHKNVYFLIAGKEEPMKGLGHPHWIEAGWTDDPGSIIQGSDIFVLPNKETYFDLVMLEVLSLGQIVLASKTGGNKYFERFSDSGIRLYQNLDEAENDIEKFLTMPAGELSALREKNLKIYNENFTTEVFAENYIKVLKKIFK